MVITRNSIKGDSGSTPIMSPSPRYSAKPARNRVDPTTKLTFGQILGLSILVSIILQASLVYLVMNDMIHIHGRATVQSLANFGARIEFILRYQALHLFWLIFTTLCVISQRIGTGAVNPLEGLENLVMAAKQIHTNSMEQFLLIFVNQLILATNLAPDIFLKVIPLMNVLFFIARILFWLGYPKYRSAGFTIGMTSISLSTLYNIYALINFIF